MDKDVIRLNGKAAKEGKVQKIWPNNAVNCKYSCVIVFITWLFHPPLTAMFPENDVR
jgi:hypothetical protein